MVGTLLLVNFAAEWYTSGTFWAGAGAVAVAASTAAVVWVTWAVGSQRRRLFYGMRAAASLLTAPYGVRSDLELRHRGILLRDPSVLTVQLVTRGRKDISSDDYDGRQPLCLDVGARIIEILQVTSEPAVLRVPNVTADGTSLRIGPALIGKRHEITITVLTDGGTPFLTCKSSLIDVQVGKYNAWPDKGPAATATATGMAAMAGMTTALVAGLVTVTTLAVAGIAVLVVVAAVDMADALAARQRGEL